MAVHRPGTRESERATGQETEHGDGAVDPPNGDVDPGGTSRRRLLVVSGSMLVGSYLANPAGAADANHYEIGARTSHWVG